MSSPKFLVLKLKDLKIPALILLIAIALLIFFMFKMKTTPTFAPSNGYQDGKYIAGITLSDGEMDVVVEVNNHAITSVSLSGLDDTSLSQDFMSSIDYINTYITATQSLDLPENSQTSTTTMLLMDAVKVALSDNPNTSVTNTYEKMDFSEPEPFVDEFSEDDFNQNDVNTASSNDVVE